ncbi:NAD(P)H-hydrate dehydratase [Ramlibacter sp. H39-3-26]|uniref:NAD(P)H-hydrate dehydratase n=1 Tax=Curvibacter soli TaxID=3031331 RepID=UPI0023DA0C2C|nr:NAD(P)H-hydrate dehydratase [Ramlibacter sp. H39-3-26]MDF1483997.1 NAD(P)H-hydrate dehydratase [Ramlibacter sp. H39-3-26]
MSEPPTLRIVFDRPHALFDIATTRDMEAAALAALPPFTLMQRAGGAVAALARALAPHARTMWVVCGGGNNGGDGLEAAARLRAWGMPVTATWLGHPDQAPADARAAWRRAVDAGVVFTDGIPAGLGADDLCIDALLGIGGGKPGRHPAAQRMQALLDAMHASPAAILCVDLPSGLDADTGVRHMRPQALHADRLHTLSLLTLKSGLFTGDGRDAAGQVWCNTLGVEADAARACAVLGHRPASTARAHASHKGSYGDVCVVGGEGMQQRGMGMSGAALLAARAALHAGAGRVFVGLLDGGALAVDAVQPELMFRAIDALDFAATATATVCGCGGGHAVAGVLPQVLAASGRLVLDADALNAIAQDDGLRHALASRGARGQATVITPHPLEAARLLRTTAADVQSQRLHAAAALARELQAVVVLKGSGTVIAHGDRSPVINPTGNALLATAGTGDVLAGMVGARLAPQGADAFDAACAAVYAHGLRADAWPAGRPLTAGRLANAASGA